MNFMNTHYSNIVNQSLSFERKLNIFSRNYLKFFLFISSFDGGGQIFTKKLFSEMISASQLLEDFLDYHGAKNNKKWYFFRELSAAVRHLSLACYSQKHILNRLPHYCLSDVDLFRNEGEATLRFLTETLINLGPVIIDEARNQGIPIPDSGFDMIDFTSIITHEILPYDIDDLGNGEQRKNIVKIASDFLKIAEHFETFAFYQPYSLKDILQIVPDKVNEVEIRRFEMLVHNLQSFFDTYVDHTGFSLRDTKLKAFRGHFSVVFHLLQVMGRLLHFYERHLHDAGYKDIYKRVRDRLAGLIDPEILLDRTINYGLYYVCHYLINGKDLAKLILNENIERGQIEVSIPITRGFHCRPSLLVAKIVQHFGGQVDLIVGKERFDASSVLDIQYAGGKIQQEKITYVKFEGDVRALKDIAILASLNYCEDTNGKGLELPKELNYIR